MNAIEYVLKLFKNVPCDFYILNVQKASSFISDDMMVMSSSATIYQTIIDTAKTSINNIISKIEKKHQNTKHQFHSIVDYDNFIDSINQTSKVNDVDLIVMGTKGASGLDKVLFGSNTVRVMQRCETPLLVIPNNCKFTDLKTIAFTTSFHSLYHLNDFEPLINLKKLNHSELLILHVLEDANMANELDKNIDFFDTHFNDATKEYIDAKNGNVYNAIHDYIVENDIKLLAMMSKKHSFFERLVTTHTVESFGFNIDIPLLVMHNKDL
jgi:nucleotide-binding universal stress UspA family protein